MADRSHRTCSPPSRLGSLGDSDGADYEQRALAGERQTFIRKAIRLAKESQEAVQEATKALRPFGLDAQGAQERLIRAKPPK